MIHVAIVALLVACLLPGEVGAGTVEDLGELSYLRDYTSGAIRDGNAFTDDYFFEIPRTAVYNTRVFANENRFLPQVPGPSTFLMSSVGLVLIVALRVRLLVGDVLFRRVLHLC